MDGYPFTGRGVVCSAEGRGTGLRMSRILTTLVAVAALGLAVVTPAHAETKTFGDKRGEVRRSADITSYTVTNGRRIAVRTHHADLTRSARSIELWVDLPGTPRRWDYHVVGSFDRSVRQVELPGRAVDTTPACRDVRVRRNVKHDWARLSVPRECIGAYDDIRVRVRVRYGPEGRLRDTAPGARTWSSWVSAVRG
jgi:hypothetical protein